MKSLPHFLFLMAAATIFITGCKKEDNKQLPVTWQVAVEYHVDNTPLQWDTLLYQNAAGEQYSVSRIQYYLSGFRFYFQGVQTATADTVVYLDPRNNAYQDFTLHGLPAGNYDSVAFYLGITPPDNIHGKLPADFVHTAMEWPDMMGGGYHFIKLEGHWDDGNNNLGYAVHLGTNPYIVACGVKTALQLSGGNNMHTLRMNINQWFRQPHDYSFEHDGVYTMGDSVTMQKIVDNGGDIFN